MKLKATILLIALASVSWTEARGMDTLVCLNAQRASLGLHPLLPDPYLQAKAEWAARTMARRQMRGHLFGKHQTVAGRWEGTARHSSRQRGPAGEYYGPEDIFACYQSHRSARYGGCASVLGRDANWYYVILLK